MKKYIAALMVILSFIIFDSKVFGVSEDFKFVIDTIGIPRYNVYGEEINEDIYYSYNVFVYSNPLNMYSKTSRQRFKPVPGMGKWTENGTAYRGAGNQGEYYMLGTTYSGSLVENVYFPVDAVPETTPDRWEYTSFAGAYESWFDTSIYKYPEQLEFMKNSNLLFDQIDYANNTSNSYNLVEYNIKPMWIGLDKIRLNAAATWKTMGVVSVKRRNNRGQIREAVLATKPMAASADIRSKLNSNDKIVLTEDKDSAKVEINFGAEAINLNNYANKKHIKEIFSILYIDDIEVSRISANKQEEISKSIEYNVLREKYKKPGVHNLNIKVKSYLYTEFFVDGLMKNIEEKNITIHIQDKKEVPVKSLSIGELFKQGDDLFVSKLVSTKETLDAKTSGFIEKGKHIGIKLELNEALKTNKENVSVYLDDKELSKNIVFQKDNIIILDVQVEKNLRNSLGSWSYFRDQKDNYFDIDFNNIGKRVGNPISLKIKIKNTEETFEYDQTFDTIDEFNLNMGYIYSDQIYNKDEINKRIALDEW